MSKTKRISVAAAVLAVVCLLGAIYLLQSSTSAQPAPQTPAAPTTQPITLSPAAQAMLENMEITKDGGVNFYTTYQGKRIRSLAISPRGSLIAGGVSRDQNTPFTDEPPIIDPVEYDKAGASGGRNWVHDFYFGRFERGEGQPRLYARALLLWGRGDNPGIQLGTTGPDNTECFHEPRHVPPGSHQNPACQPTTYGPRTDTTPGTSLGKIAFNAWGEGEFQGNVASITARNDMVPTKTKNPGSMHFHIAGSTNFTDPKKAARAWRDPPERMVIKSNGNVGIGDEPSPTERLHVEGNILANGNITAKGDVVAAGAKKFSIDHPTQAGKQLVHAAIEGPEAAVYYRGEAQLTNGRAVIALPEYFEALTAKAGRTVTLTNLDGFNRLAVQSQGGVSVKDGKFIVVSESPESTQKFFWEVKAIRGDIQALRVTN